MNSGNSANVVDGKLILSFPMAVNPVIWQMDLNKAKSCALEVQEDKKKKQFLLQLKSNSQEAENIAAFEDKQSAVDAMMAASSALQNASGQINPAAVVQQVAPTGTANVTSIPTAQVPVNTKSSESGDNKKAALLAVFLIVILVIIWSVSIPRNAGPLLSTNEIVGAIESAGSGESSTGVAVSADEFLNRNR